MVDAVGDVECVSTYSDDVLVCVTADGGLAVRGHQWIDVAERVGFSPESLCAEDCQSVVYDR